MLKFLSNLLGVTEITIHGAFFYKNAAVSLSLDAILDTDLTIIPGKTFGVVFKGCSIGIAMSGEPTPEPSLTVSNTLELTLTWAGADELLLTGSITASAG